MFCPKTCLWFGILASALYGGSMQTKAESPFNVGDSFPDQWFPDASDGSPRHLIQWFGKKFVRHLFASW
jgi:hypothetical protein